MECLLEQKVDTIFGYPGGTILNLYDELYNYQGKLHHYLTAHEQGAAHAADGYARSTGKVGVCFATSGPGATNLTTGIATAYYDSSPVVFITCNVTENVLGKDAFQEVDITGIAMPITKATYLVRDPQTIPDIIREAFAVAATGRPGPVLIDFLKNVTAPSVMIDYEFLPRAEHIKHGRLAALTRRMGWDIKTPEPIHEDVDKLVETIALISKSFGGINLEDIAAPRCFEVERRLKEVCDIPVFHDDQHGTAIVVAAALLNAMRVTGKQMGQMKIVINGAGAAGIAIGKLLISMGFGNIVMCDINGIICEGDEGLNAGQEEISHISNREHEHGTLADALRGADAFVGVSRPNLVTAEMVSTMKDGIVFAMANPTPEIMPDEAKRGGAAVVGTGRSDFPNQINNVMVFPGIFKGTLAVRAREITEGMKIRAARALAALVTDEQLSADYILPSALDKSVADTVARAVAQEAREQGIARA